MQLIPNPDMESTMANTKTRPPTPYDRATAAKERRRRRLAMKASRRRNVTK